jgi:hypothetical protein
MPGAVYITSMIDNNQYCKTNGQFTRYLRKHQLTYQQYFETYVSKNSPKCECGKPLTFYQKTETYANSCGDPRCVGKTVSLIKNNWTDEQRHKDSKNKKLAATLRTDDQKYTQYLKAKQTFQQKYGVEWGSNLDTQKEKSRNTKKERYGLETYNNSKQTSIAWQNKTDKERTNIVNKRRKTCLSRFGVENALMKPEARTKSAKSNSKGKEFILPSGKVIGIRGYENTVIDKLLENYSEGDLKFDDRLSEYTLPVFDYVNMNQHTMKYYPDIYIKAENKLIEVKSRWWWEGNGAEKYKSRLENNLRKKDAVLTAGYNYEVWLFSTKTNYEVLQWKK